MGSPKKMKNLLRVFSGTVEGASAGVATVTEATTLRDVLVHGELKPEEWPKFRMILIELWHSSILILRSTSIILEKRCVRPP